MEAGNDMIARWPNPAHALDGGIPPLLYTGRPRPAASDAHREPSGARLVHIRITISLTALCIVLAGCIGAPGPGGSGWTDFAFSTPGHLEDCRKLQTALAGAGIRCSKGISNLGTWSMSVDSRDFDRAKQEATGLAGADALTLRIRASRNSWAYEVWQSGKKVREETYVVEKGK